MAASSSALDIINELIHVYSDLNHSNISYRLQPITNTINSRAIRTPEQNRIFLWSTRRVLSMAFHRAVYQLDGIKHLCEPFALPFYFGENRKSVQFADNQQLSKKFNPCPTYADSLQKITKKYSDKYHTVFIKEHAIYAWPDAIPKEILSASINTFIIRNPTKAIKSLYRQTLFKFDESLWDHVVTQEIGFKELYLMYDFVVNTLRQKTVIIDADDLLNDPKTVLIKYCAFVGLQYNESMLDWSNDYKKDEAAPWDFVPGSWIVDVKNSNGFRKTDKKHDPNIKYPKYIDEAIQESVPYYEKLYAQRLRL